MHDKLFEKIMELQKRNELFAIATVVRRIAPSSGKAGDKAIISRFGELIGWIGGGCVQGIVRKEAESAMRSGQPVLARIGKNLVNNEKIDGTVDYRMTCQSEGTVEIFIEPMMPKPHLIVLGKSEIAKALVALANTAGYRITAVADGADLKTFGKVDELITQYKLDQVNVTPASFIVVATQGDQDETALVAALSKPAAYVGFVASRKKMQSLRKYLNDIGIASETIDAVRSPAGIDINAKKPFEVAISILAEMVEVTNGMEFFSGYTQNNETVEGESSAKVHDWYINPVCGVPVDKNNPKHVINYNNEDVYFCCDGCKVKFEKDPEKYIQARALGLEPEGM